MGTRLVLHSRTPFHKGGEGSGNFHYNGLLHHTVQCWTCWSKGTSRKKITRCESTVKPRAAALLSLRKKQVVLMKVTRSLSSHSEQGMAV